MDPEIVIASVAVILFVFVWIFRKKKQKKKTYPLSAEYDEARRVAWIVFAGVYGRGVDVRREIDLHIVSLEDMPPKHPAVAWWMGSDRLLLNKDGYNGRTPRYWFVAELHNVYRYRIGLPYRPITRSDKANFKLVSEYLEDVK